MKRKVLAILEIILLALALVAPVIAAPNDINVPDSTISVIKVFAYENVLISGDQEIIAEINIPYATPPTIPSSQAYMARMIDNTGTEIASTPVTSYFDSGYGYNTIALYFSTAVIPWNTVPTYSLILNGSPTLNWIGGPYPTVTVPSTSFIWNNSTSIATTQNYIYGQIITWADTLGAYWNIEMTTFIGSTKVFSTYGEAYFPSAIPGLNQMCPQLFATTSAVPTYTDKKVNTTAASQTLSTFPLDFTGIAQWLGFTDGDAAFRGLGMVILIIFVSMAVGTKSPGSVIPVAFAMLIGCAAIGWVTPVLAAGVIFAIIVVFSLIFLLGKPIG